jgi:hypothetical protein
MKCCRAGVYSAGISTSVFGQIEFESGGLGSWGAPRARLVIGRVAAAWAGFPARWSFAAGEPMNLLSIASPGSFFRAVKSVLLLPSLYSNSPLNNAPREIIEFSPYSPSRTKDIVIVTMILITPFQNIATIQID